MKINIKRAKRMLLFAFSSVILASSCFGQKEIHPPFVDIFDGETLDGWHILGGDASYEVKDGTIVGTSTLNTTNTFLCSEELYSDFILEFDNKVDSQLNSGVQIRSKSIPSYRNGVVHGYQIEIDPSERAWSAGIYEEQARGWLYNLVDNPKAQQAFKQNQWNRYRVEAIGDTLKTWINGVEATHLIDDRTDSGFIGLQVHGIGNDEEKNGIQVVWKNIKILTKDLDSYSKTMTLSAKNTKNKLTDKERIDGWKMLWDGKTTAGWRGAKLDKFPEQGWEIKDGLLSVITTGDGQSTEGGDIVTTELYGNFEFKVDFKIKIGRASCRERV